MVSKQMKYYFIINKWAGARHSAETWQKMHHLLVQNQVEFDSVVTEYPRHATELAQQFATSHRKGWIIVAFGGDGTLMEVLEGVQRVDATIPLGYIPAGSGNDFARTVGLSRDPYLALQQLIQTTQPTVLDVGAYQDRKEPVVHYFSNNVGIGFDASVVYQANQGQKIKLSKWHLESTAYISALLKTLIKQKGFPMSVTIDGKTRQFKNAFLVSITNIKYFGGGVGIAPQARLDDDKLDVVITEKLTLLRFIRLFAKLLKDGSHLAMPDVFFATGREVLVHSFAPEHGQVNGEDLPYQPFDLKIWTVKQSFWFTLQTK